MSLEEFFENLMDFYQKSLLTFERRFDTYTYISYDVSKYEKVYIVEDSFIVYIGIKQTQEITDFTLQYAYEDPYGRFIPLTGHIFIIEELTYNDIHKINASKLRREIFGEYARYAPYIYKFFNLDINKPIKNLNFVEEENYLAGKREYWKTNFFKVDSLFPFLELKSRLEEWKGKPYTFILYEVNYNGWVGVAVNSTTSPYITKHALKTIKEMEKAVRNIYETFDEINLNDKDKEKKFYVSQDIGGTLWYTFPYSLNKGFSPEAICWNDYIFRKILLIKLRDYYRDNNIDVKSSSEIYPRFISEGSLRYWTFTDYMKTKNFSEKYIDIIINKQHYIKYASEPMEYHKVETCWKSEELVYECVKKVFKHNDVVHQHRPYFLRTKNGQMSYDVFVYGEEIAFEYQGKQHFEPVEYFGGKEHFNKQKQRDKLKRKLSEEHGIILIYINYWEDVTIELIREKISDAFKQRKIKKNKYYLK